MKMPWHWLFCLLFLLIPGAGTAQQVLLETSDSLSPVGTHQLVFGKIVHQYMSDSTRLFLWLTDNSRIYFPAEMLNLPQPSLTDFYFVAGTLDSVTVQFGKELGFAGEFPVIKPLPQAESVAALDSLRDTICVRTGLQTFAKGEFYLENAFPGAPDIRLPKLSLTKENKKPKPVRVVGRLTNEGATWRLSDLQVHQIFPLLHEENQLDGLEGQEVAIKGKQWYKRGRKKKPWMLHLPANFIRYKGKEAVYILSDGIPADMPKAKQNNFVLRYWSGTPSYTWFFPGRRFYYFIDRVEWWGK